MPSDVPGEGSEDSVGPVESAIPIGPGLANDVSLPIGVEPTSSKASAAATVSRLGGGTRQHMSSLRTAEA
jgi:hypothetical protein